MSNKDTIMIIVPIFIKILLLTGNIKILLNAYLFA